MTRQIEPLITEKTVIKFPTSFVLREFDFPRWLLWTNARDASPLRIYDNLFALSGFV